MGRHWFYMPALTWFDSKMTHQFKKIKVYSYSGKYTGLSIRKREFNSLIDRQRLCDGRFNRGR